MEQTMNVPGYIAINRDFAHTVLPDRGLIQRPGGVRMVRGYGVLVPGQTTNVSFNGSDLIPCRFDASRAFRPDGLREQEAVVNEYIAHFHRGVDVRPDDRIVLLEPIEVTANGRFLGGLSGWGGAVTGLTYQEFKPPGVKLITADDTTQLLTQTLAITLGQRVLVLVWAEVSDGTVVFHTDRKSVV